MCRNNIFCGIVKIIKIRRWDSTVSIVTRTKAGLLGSRDSNPGRDMQTLENTQVPVRSSSKEVCLR
jgi:hypothetical protein